MNPKKVKFLIKETADELNKDENLVNDLVSFFWDETHKSLNEIRGNRVFMAGFGTFVVKDWEVPVIQKRLQDIVNSYERMIESNRMNYRKYAIKKDVESRLATINNVIKIIEEEKLRKQEKRKKRNEEIKNNLEKQMEDSSGDIL